MDPENKLVSVCSSCGKLVTNADYIPETMIFFCSRCGSKVEIQMSMKEAEKFAKKIK